VTSPPIVALEIGTTKVRAVIGEVRDEGVITVIGVGEDASEGVRKSEIVKLDTATEQCRRVVAAAEADGDVTIRQVYIAVSGSHIRSDPSYGTAYTRRSDRVVAADEIEEVREAARSINLAPDREILHSVGQLYKVDDRAGILDPEGMVASRLEQNVLIIHGASSAIHNTIRAATLAKMDVVDTAFGGLCSALAVLDADQKTCGVAVIDLGGGTTDVVVYAHKILAHAASIGIGGDHVTNDLSVGLHLPTRQAEAVKVQHGHAMLSSSRRGQAVAVPADGTFAGRSIRDDDIRAIVNARMDELFKIIHADLAQRNLLCHLGAGLVLTGGGAQMNGVADLAQRIFNMPCAIGRPCGMSGLSKITGGPGYAASLGLLRYAAMTSDDDCGGSRVRQIFKRLFRFAEGE